MSLLIAELWILPVLSIVACHCAASGILKRNHVAGFRIPSVMASDAAWRAGHRAAIPLIWLTVPVALMGTAGASMMTNPGLRGLVILATTIAFLAILLRAAVIASRAARGVDRG
jgi:hypothetical protein